MEGQAGKALPRSSSRGGLALKQKETNLPPTSDLTREAEEWRQTPIFHRGEVNLSKYEETDGVIGVVSPWLELDSADEGIRFDSEIALRQELSYASHLGIAHVLLPPPSSDPACQPFLADYARAIAGCLQTRGAEAPAAGHFMTLSIRLPISSPYNLAQTMLRNHAGLSFSGSSSSVSPAQLRSDDDWSWQAWHVIESICQYSTRLSVALDLSAPLPSAYTLYRWNSEPVSHIWLPSRAFLSNAKGYPVLSKACQSLLRSLVSVKSSRLGFIIVGSQSPPSYHSRGGQAAYEQYIRHLEKSAPPLSAGELQAHGYADYLQAPLQPLFDNLEAQTYATFEADSTKYIQYEEAVYQALTTRPYKATVRIWVCGAGRGPLVERCIQAARRARKSVKIVALEKNVNAIIGLKERAVTEWGLDVVEVRLGDMIVSELLGSFGDNELSPECLDGAMRFLKRECRLLMLGASCLPVHC
jgi:protein arginine N-methyltransferase 5